MDLKYSTSRLIVAFLASILELWLLFYVGSRPWVERWAENAMFWQLVLTSAALIVWVCRGAGEYERNRALAREYRDTK